MDDSEARWPNPWVRAGLDLALLASLRGEPLHGYGIAARLEAAGMGRLKGGSLYPALARLEQAGLVEADWQPGDSGPGRKAYRLTALGEEERARLMASWQGLTDALHHLGQSVDEGVTR